MSPFTMTLIIHIYLFHIFSINVLGVNLDKANVEALETKLWLAICLTFYVIIDFSELDPCLFHAKSSGRFIPH